MLLLGLSLAGCNSNSQTKSSDATTSTATTTSSRTGESTTTTTSTAAVTASGDKSDAKADTKSGAPVKGAKEAAAKDDKTAAPTKDGKTAASKDQKTAISSIADGMLPAVVEAQAKIDLAKMPDGLVICTVGGAPVTVGDYRRERRLQLEQIRAQLSMDSGLLQELLAIAKEKNLALSKDEQKKLIDTSHKAEAATGGVLDKILKEHHMTVAEFDKHVLDIGLAMKAAAYNVDRHLLSELVDRELLCAAGTAGGFGPRAFNKYVEIKKSPAYEMMLKSGMMSADELKDETVKSELMSLEVEKIQNENPITDAQIADFYEKNKAKFKHGDRVRLSQIVVACPPLDGPQGIRDQIKKKNPNITPTELDMQAKLAEQQAHNKAEEILGKAMKGEDFARLANTTSDEPSARLHHNGGDLGYQNKDQLQKDFVDKIWPLKVGQVYPNVIPSPMGLFIFKVTDKQSAGIMALAELKAPLKQALMQKNQGLSLAKWLTDRRKSVPIVVDPKFLAIASANTKSNSATQ